MINAKIKPTYEKLTKFSQKITNIIYKNTKQKPENKDDKKSTEQKNSSPKSKDNNDTENVNENVVDADFTDNKSK